MEKLKSLKTILIILILFFIFLFQKTSAQGNLIYLAEVEGEIKAGTLQYLKKVVKEAEKAQASYILIKLDTPGGLVKATKDIVDLILGTKVKTIIFVHKKGGWAYSAGTFILMAADFAIVHPEASIGAAQPREMGIDQVKEPDPKIIEGMASWMKGLTQTKQRNSEVAEKFVRENLTLTGSEAKELGVIDETAKDLEELFFKLQILQPKIIEIKQTSIEKFFDLLSHPYLISLFLTLGTLGLVFAFRTGEFESLGILGLILFFIGLWGIGIINFNILGLIFLILGITLLLLEVFQPGLGIFGFLGIISLLFGIFTFQAEPFLNPQVLRGLKMLVLGMTLGLGFLFIVIGKLVVKALKTRPQTGPESLIGLEAEVIKELNPFGRVKVDDQTWQAKSLSHERIAERSKVKVVKVEGNTLFVEKKE
jgi:membrane-bound serine protease (ClpP class)